jgi:hypothetical protein
MSEVVMKTAAIAAALLFSLSSFALAQGSGGSSSGSGAGTGGTSSSGSSNNAVGTYPSSPTVGTTGQDPRANNNMQGSSPNQQQLQRNQGMGTAPNGRPVGSPGSGLGSPEQPHDAGARQ